MTRRLRQVTDEEQRALMDRFHIIFGWGALQHWPAFTEWLGAQGLAPAGGDNV